MKMLILASVFVASSPFVGAPASAQGCSGVVGTSYTGSSANCRDRLGANSGYYPGTYYEGQYYPYGYFPNQVQIGRTKREKDPENRDQFCGNGVGWVPYGKPCPEKLDDGRFKITKTTKPDGSVETTYTPVR